MATLQALPGGAQLCAIGHAVIVMSSAFLLSAVVLRFSRDEDAAHDRHGRGHEAAALRGGLVPKGLAMRLLKQLATASRGLFVAVIVCATIWLLLTGLFVGDRHAYVERVWDLRVLAP